MTLKILIKKFFREDAGAITVEVMAMGGVLVVFGVFAVAGIVDGVEELEEERGYRLEAQDKISTF
ncbi:hypothetical protein [Litoreibacter arenae]|uniref:Uncharacterized protein n=1 Tax=Litoreibacter arenae DSM 19593 TaxID=1123360 RepID=S9QM14_9RHOB|nr:hypothetical protein [Litoreibacter arenae]EPX80792.1 hypothetical protein thalar_01012 [Litoreibacter arenae DSM 19593]